MLVLISCWVMFIFLNHMTSPIECRAKKKCGRNSVRWTVNPFQSYSRVFIALINIRLVFFFLSFSLAASFTFTLCVPHNLKYSHYHDNTVSSVRISAFFEAAGPLFIFILEPEFISFTKKKQNKTKQEKWVKVKKSIEEKKWWFKRIALRYPWRQRALRKLKGTLSSIC